MYSTRKLNKELLGNLVLKFLWNTCRKMCK